MFFKIKKNICDQVQKLVGSAGPDLKVITQITNCTTQTRIKVVSQITNCTTQKLKWYLKLRTAQLKLVLKW